MKTFRLPVYLIILFLSGLILSACGQAKANDNTAAPDAAVALDQSVSLEFTLQTLINDGGLAYIGVGGEIDGIVNPDLVVEPDSVIRLVLINGDGMQHDLYLPDFQARTGFVNKVGDQSEIIFEVQDVQPGTYVYYCTVPGHWQAGQEGNLIVAEP